MSIPNPVRLAGVLLAGTLAACSGNALPAETEPVAFEQYCAPVQGSVGTREDGYRGVWYMNEPQGDQYRYKYSGGLATYPQQHIPMAVYATAVNRTFFVYGGGSRDRNSLRNMVSFYDHRTGMVPRPVAVTVRGTNDAHFNPTIGLDRQGHVYVFANIHGG
ncbi:MAG TPA: hypothetical protein VFY65_11100, partial [Longimicrobium sp.]|nr:hypothetical protein [Longimicrobium sp.]